MTTTTTTYALRRHDGTMLPERFTPDEAAAAMRLDPWLADPFFGDLTLVGVDA